MADPTATCATLVNAALRIAGITGRPMRVPSPDQSAEVIPILNRMLGSWNIDPLKIFETSQDRYALTPSQTTYFIGPTGDMHGPGNFVAPRPARIVRANVVVTNAFPEIHKELEIYEVTDWAGLSIPELPGAWPRRLYNDHATPDSKLYLYPVVSIPSDLELFTLLALQQFAALADVVVLPDGYEEAIVYNLARRVVSTFKHQGAAISPDDVDIANTSLAMIESGNAPVPHLINDAAGLGSPRTGDSQWWRSGGY
jgi:hypothetical protein